MTVCITSFSIGQQVGGIPAYNSYLCSNLLTMGHKVILLTFDETAGLTDENETRTQGDLTTVILKASYQHYLQKFKAYFRPGSYGAPGWLAMGMAMKEWLLKNHRTMSIDIIEAADYGGAGALLLSNDLPPVAIAGHSSFLQLKRYNSSIKDDHSAIIEQMELFAYLHADGILTHSHLNAEDLCTLTGRQVYFSRAPWTTPSAVVEDNSNDSKSNLVISGLQFTKGPAIMAEATRIISKKNKDWNIYWIGGDTYSAPGGTLVSTYLAKNYADIWKKNFIWIPEKKHTEVIKAIRNASVCIIPSLWETFNYFALEAAYSQKPLILTEKTGAAYLFVDDPNTKIIPANDANSLASILSNEPMLTNWIKGITGDTKQRLIDYFSPVKIIDERINVYKTIIMNRQPLKASAAKELLFLQNYLTPRRKWYYSFRKKFKSIVKGN